MTRPLSPLFDRIGMSRQDQDILADGNRITNLLHLQLHSLSNKPAPGGISEDARVLFAALLDFLRHLLRNSDRGRSPERLVENVLKKPKFAKYSWEAYWMERFVDPDPSPKPEPKPMSKSGGELLKVPDDPNHLLLDLQDFRTNINGTGWIYDRKQSMVKLNDVEILEENGVDVRMSVPRKVFQPLYPHQAEGVKRIFQNFDTGLNGLLLGDEMGLGKTRQVLVSCLSALMSKKIKRVLALVPATLITTWVDEIKTLKCHYPRLFKDHLKIVLYSSKLSAERRNKYLREKRKNNDPLLVLASTSLVPTNSDRANNPLFPTGRDSNMFWDWIVVDEAHRGAKNPKTNFGSALRSKLTENAFVILLTATPIQNNLGEFCSLLHLVSRQKNFDDFLKKYEKGIMRGHQKKSKPWERERAGKLIEDLQEIAKPYILQRSLNETLKDVLPSKKEFCVWIDPSDAQIKVARNIHQSEKAEDAKATLARFHVFAIIMQLRLASFHPSFVAKFSDDDIQNMLESMEREDGEKIEEIEDHIDIEGTGSPKEMLEGSPMFQVCRELLVNLIEGNHKILVFSLFRKPLKVLSDIIQKVDNIGFYEINGSISQPKRDQSIKDFNNEKSLHKVMFCTIGSGGLGLTLTGADRVIILGASYNPMEDAQAVARAYRIGQDKPVEVYRLLMASMVDEKVSPPV
eukprot:scaffold3257_cov152-Amphora_coffeaeformis.AAC.3